MSDKDAGQAAAMYAHECGKLRKEIEMLRKKISFYQNDKGRLHALAEIDKICFSDLLEYDPLKVTPVDAALSEIKRLREALKRISKVGDEDFTTTDFLAKVELYLAKCYQIAEDALKGVDNG